MEIARFFTVTRAQAQLPLQVEDASRPDSAFEANAAYVRPGRDTRLDNRVLDLRTPANVAIFRVRAAIQQEFQRYLNELGFTQITSPKIQGGSSEGGADVFKLNYFGRPACLA